MKFVEALKGPVPWWSNSGLSHIQVFTKMTELGEWVLIEGLGSQRTTTDASSTLSTEESYSKLCQWIFFFFSEFDGPMRLSTVMVFFLSMIIGCYGLLGTDRNVVASILLIRNEIWMTGRESHHVHIRLQLIMWCQCLSFNYWHGDKLCKVQCGVLT